MPVSIAGCPISVVGGGVGGLAVARALALRGADVTLHEQAPEIAEIGAGLQISPNGQRVIDALGLGPALNEVSMQARAVALRDGLSGRAVLRMDLGRASGRYAFVHRARLVGILEDGARQAGVEIRLGEHRLPETGGLTVAADGLHSVHRRHLNGDRPPFFTGQVAWRAVIPDRDAAPVAEVFMAPGRHLVSYPLAGGLRNIVAVEERAGWAEEGWHHADDPGAVRTAFSGFGGPVPDWLARIDTVNLWGLFRHPVAGRWHGKGIVLLGDAAHPTLPFLAQGANLALEDAWVLADALDRWPEAGALSRYQAARMDRARRVVDAATANARNYHLGGPARALAHLALRIGSKVAPGAALRRFDWLYGYDATRAFLRGPAG